MAKYILRCPKCGKIYKDTYLQVCLHDEGMIRTEYTNPQLVISPLKGIWKFKEWLPVYQHLNTEGGMSVFKSKGLARELGLKNLFIAFNGYYPEKEAFLKTGTFKELEASPTIARAIDKKIKNLVIASAGNTARSFAYIATQVGFNTILVVPPNAVDKIWVPTSIEPNTIQLITLKGDKDYFDAISFANNLCKNEFLETEGGARNVARRDGMGTVMLEAAISIGRLPDHYIQAVGSGTGAIAAYETSERLIRDGTFGNKLPKLHLMQNLPFAPMSEAWNNQSRELLLDKDPSSVMKKINSIYASVLANRKPPYSVPGGVFDCLTQTNGTMSGVTNHEAKGAQKLFEDTEGVDIVPAAAVAVAGLCKMVEEKAINLNDTILLNITGGGCKRIKDEVGLQQIKPTIVSSEPDRTALELTEIIALTN